MSDRELLELAAKAAGYVIRDSTRWKNTVVCQVTLDDGSTNYVQWNPITDDGDALRLAVKLRLEPRFIDNGHSNGVEPSRVTLHNFAGIVENIDGDPLAATRRAIVRAAAEIGRRMP